jgi:hypothetical protein
MIPAQPSSERFTETKSGGVRHDFDRGGARERVVIDRRGGRQAHRQTRHRVSADGGPPRADLSGPGVAILLVGSVVPFLDIFIVNVGLPSLTSTLKALGPRFS